MDAWDRELGTRQGRIAPAGASPAAGDYVYCLGFDLPLHTEELKHQDFAQVEQSATFPANTKILRASATVRPPLAVPTGYKWELALLVDSVIVALIELRPSARTRLRTLSANVSKLGGGAHVVTMRLQFAYTSALYDALLTEGGDVLLTEFNEDIEVEA